jgi:hypothetical protein
MNISFNYTFLSSILIYLFIGMMTFEITKYSNSVFTFLLLFFKYLFIDDRFLVTLIT